MDITGVIVTADAMHCQRESTQHITGRGGHYVLTDNGVALCWFHHRSIDQGGWHVTMRHGVPHVRAPGWIDPTGAWRPVGINHNGPRRHRT
jgi:hypothetical protein